LQKPTFKNEGQWHNYYFDFYLSITGTTTHSGLWLLRWDESVKGLAFASTCADLAPRIEDRATHAVTEKMVGILLGTKESTFPRTQDCILLRILPRNLKSTSVEQHHRNILKNVKEQKTRGLWENFFFVESYR